MIKRITSFQFILIAVFAAVMIAPVNSFAQGQIVGGTEYWLGIPHCRKEANEPFRGTYAMAIWISSKVETQATVLAKSIGFERRVRIFPNRITEVPMPDNLMHKRSEVIEQFGIQVLSEEPVSVAVYLSYKWSGEAYRVTPVEWLGKEYVTLNMYQDKTDEIKPAQIMIIATEDNTTVKYKPKWHTNKVRMGRSKTIKMNQGETYLIEGKMDPAVTQDWISDLTGTIITASKPVAVLSGHTKGAFPRYSYTMLGRAANFMRNMLIDMMWPNELLGKQYVSAPVKYNNRTKGKIADDMGDLIRFVAIEDETVLEVLREDGSAYKIMHPNMDKGEYYDFTNWERAAIFRSSKPMLAGQYGKTWWSRAVRPEADKGGDDIQNPPRNGQGMLIVLAPLERWTSYASFRSPYAIDNFVYITFRAEDAKHLKFDGKKFVAQFGNSFGYIEGTDFAYITEQVAAGDHYIEADEGSGATFAGYAYGNWDRSKDGFAYGYPIGINFATPCEDSLFVIDTIICGNVEATATVVPEESPCAGIFSVRFLDSKSSNYEFTVDDFERGLAKTVNYKLEVIDLRKEAHGEVVIMTKSGKTIKKVYDYVPERIAADPEEIDFGVMAINDTKCLTVTLSNPGTVPVHVETLYLRFSKAEFYIDISGLPVDLDPGETKDVEICATALEVSDVPVIDTVIATLTCYDDPVVPLKVLVKEPTVWIGDAHFGRVLVNEEQKMEVVIRNDGNLPVIIDTLTYPDEDKQYFLRYEGLDFPVTLPSYNDVEYFDVYFKTDVAGIQHKTTAIMDVNTDKIKIESYWSGEGMDAGLSIEGYNWYNRRVADKFADLDHPVKGYEGYVIIKNTKTDDVVNIDVQILNDDANVFSFDNRDEIPSIMVGKQVDTLKVWFLPGPDQPYVFDVPVRITGMFNTNPLSEESSLLGSGHRPRIEIGGDDFGSQRIKIGKDTTIDVPITNVCYKYPEDGEMGLTIFNGITITGPDADDFTIDSDWLANIGAQYPLMLNPVDIDRILNVPITFEASHEGPHIAYLEANHDDPLYTDRGELIGNGVDGTTEATDKYLGLHFISKTSPVGYVYLINTFPKGEALSPDINFIEPLSIQGPDANNFSYKGLGIKVGYDGAAPADFPYVIGPGDSLYVPVYFTPHEPRDYSTADKQFSAYIDYIFEYSDNEGVKDSSLTSDLWGDGKVQLIRVQINKGYEITPGPMLKEITVNLEKRPEESKPLAEAGIMQFKVSVDFPKNIFDEELRLGNFWLKDDLAIEEIIDTKGCVVEGWTIDPTNKILDNDRLYLNFISNGDALSADFSSAQRLPLFRFKVQGMLSATNEEIPLIPRIYGMMDSEGSASHVLADSIRGDIKVDPVCANDTRIIFSEGIEYSLAEVNPNPVNNSTVIHYSIGIDAPTELSIFNSFGVKIATVVNQTQKAGSYEIEINTTELGLASGSYHYTLKSGPFEQTRSMVVVK